MVNASNQLGKSGFYRLPAWSILFHPRMMRSLLHVQFSVDQMVQNQSYSKLDLTVIDDSIFLPKKSISVPWWKVVLLSDLYVSWPVGISAT